MKIQVFKKYVILVLPIILWFVISEYFKVPEIYLPKIQTILSTFWDMKLDLLFHTISTLEKILISLIFGTSLGIFLPLVLFKHEVLEDFLPIVNSIRAVPATAILPFFLLWFGFSDIGKVLLLTLAFGLNIFVASSNVVLTSTEKEKVLFASFGNKLNSKMLTWWFYRILETVLPTIRFGLTTILGVVVVAEMLGSQQGLGYLIQTSRTTFSFDVIFLCALIFGLLTVLLDYLITNIWQNVVFWK